MQFRQQSTPTPRCCSACGHPQAKLVSTTSLRLFQVLSLLMAPPLQISLLASRSAVRISTVFPLSELRISQVSVLDHPKSPTTLAKLRVPLQIQMRRASWLGTLIPGLLGSTGQIVPSSLLQTLSAWTRKFIFSVSQTPFLVRHQSQDILQPKIVSFSIVGTEKTC